MTPRPNPSPQAPIINPVETATAAARASAKHISAWESVGKPLADRLEASDKDALVLCSRLLRSLQLLEDAVGDSHALASLDEALLGHGLSLAYRARTSAEPWKETYNLASQLVERCRDLGGGL